MTPGYLHSIETFGTVDGPGTRLVIFLAGCQLGCTFCHNPDTWDKGTKQITVPEILQTYKRYQGFYKNGGITISGGEPLLQPDFLLELLKATKAENIHTVVDTSGFAPAENIPALRPWVDQWLFSIKSIDPEMHKKITCQDNTLILKNLTQVISGPGEVTLRYILLPGLTNREQDIKAWGTLIHSFKRPPKVEVLPYHTLGKPKWQTLGWNYRLEDLPPATDVEVKELEEQLKQKGITLTTSSK